MTLAFTGHRPEFLPFTYGSDAYYQFELALWNEIGVYVDAGYDTFYCGAARGTDILCGEIILALKEGNAFNLKLICAIPFREQARGWNLLWRALL